MVGGCCYFDPESVGHKNLLEPNIGDKLFPRPPSGDFYWLTDRGAERARAIWSGAHVCVSVRVAGDVCTRRFGSAEFISEINDCPTNSNNKTRQKLSKYSANTTREYTRTVNSIRYLSGRNMN